MFTQMNYQLEEVCGREWVKVLLKHYTTSTTINTLVHKMVNGKNQWTTINAKSKWWQQRL